MSITKKFFILFLCLVVIVGGFIVYQVIENREIEINEFSVKSDKIPVGFNGFRIAQVSDLHNAEFGKNNEILVSRLKESKPDMVVLTGDLIDSRNTKVDVALNFTKQCVKIAPTYYVTGNHESRILEDYERLKNGLLNLGVTVLENETVNIMQNGETISLIGLVDPAFKTVYDVDDEIVMLSSKLNEMVDENYYTVLLSHRPELFETYVENNVNLAFSGHAHGGQIRLPFVGGLLAPHQGLFPYYDSGKYTDGDTSMMVSRGIGNSLFPLRVNNKPEIIVAELNNE